jgi:uncharacterized cofD-like protein
VKITGIGGGHGLATTLRAARLVATEVEAVVSVADDGGSSGRLTRELGIPPPGDIRNCLVALARNERLAETMQHRFQEGALTGHTIGNLVIAALTEMSGDFARAVETTGELLQCSGRVHPATTQLVNLRARVQGGEIVGQVAVAQTPAPIQAVYLEPAEPPACRGAIDAITSADIVVLGPGSLFTSLIATTLVPGIKEALLARSGGRAFVCNARMQKGETWGLTAAQHVEALLAHVGPFCVDTIVVQAPVRGADGVVIDRDALGFLGIDVVEADVANPNGTHVPERLAEVLAAL